MQTVMIDDEVKLLSGTLRGCIGTVEAMTGPIHGDPERLLVNVNGWHTRVSPNSVSVVYRPQKPLRKGKPMTSRRASTQTTWSKRNNATCRHRVKSDSGRIYTVAVAGDEYQCSCPGWTMHYPRRDCKHIRHVKEHC